MFNRLLAHLRRQSRPQTRRASRQRFLEQLEPRMLFASVPVAVNDPFYSTALNTAVSASGSGAVLANDFQVDSHALSASVVANPAHGTLTAFNASTGAFTYTPTTGFTGFDTFTYQASDGGTLSNVATVTISVGQTFGPRTNLDDNPLNSVGLLGVPVITRDLSLGEQLVYRSDAVSLKPIVVVETSLLSTSAVPNSIDAQLTFGGVVGSTVGYTNSGLEAGDTLRFALQADASSLTTGYYDWTLTITANYTGSTTTTTYTGSQAVVNRTGSEYGKGWWLNGLDQLYDGTNGALLVRGNGDSLWFPKSGGTYSQAAGDTEFSTLVKNGNNTFTLTTKQGIGSNFSTTGLLTSIVDRNGNTISYGYTDADGDTVSDELSTITDPYSRAHSLSYTSGKATSFTDYASHATTLAYTAGKLTSVTLTDPDGGGSLAAPVWAYAYTSDLLTTMTDPLSNATVYTYNSTSKRLSQIDVPNSFNNIAWTPLQSVGLKTGTGNALVETVNPEGSYTDANGNTFTFRTDRFGGFTSYRNTTDQTDIWRDANGLPYKVLQPDPGSGRPQTLMGYNASGDLLRQINPDTTALNWTYDSTYHQVLTAADEMSRTTTYTYDASGNELTRADNAGNTWTTDYTGRTDGLPTSVTSPDPDGAGPLSAYVTGYAYDSYGRLTTTTNPDSTTTVLAYDSANNVTSSTDELSHVTSYAFDALNRLTSVTGADPDGAGALTAPVTSYVYDAMNNKTSETDALGNETAYEYDEAGYLTEKTEEDPDGAGPLSGPVTTLTPDGLGNVEFAGYAMMGGNPYQYDYDVYNRKTYEQGPLVNGERKLDTWTFDVLGRMTSHTNSLSLWETEHWTYDSRGRMLSHAGFSFSPHPAPTTTYTYNYAGQMASETDPLGNVTQYTYTTAGWLNSITYPDPDGSGPLYSPVVTFGYDALGRRTSVTDANNRITTTTYNWRGQIVSETRPDPDGAGGGSPPSTTNAYDNAGRLTSVTDPLGYVTSYGYDNLNRQTSMTLPDPDGAGALSAPVYGYGYNAVGSQTTETDPLGNVTTTAYDNLQRKISVTGADPDGGGSLTSPVTTWEYGGQGLVTKLTDPLGTETTYGYDGYGRQTTVTNDSGEVTTTAYNLLDMVTSVTLPDPDGAGSLTAPVTSYAYDYLNRLATVTDPRSKVTSYTYDLMDRMLTLEDPDSNTTTWAYDNLGRVTLETNELSESRSFWYDAIGNLTRKMDRNGRVSELVYDNLDRPTEEKWLTSGSPVGTVTPATTTPGGPLNEVQRVGYTISSGGVMGGTFTLTFGGNTTGTIAYNASAATVQGALEGLVGIGSGNVSVVKTTDVPSGSQVWTVSFQGALAGADQSQITINTSGLFVFGTKTDVQATDVNGAATGTSEVQTITLANATGGTFRLAFSGQTTAPLAYNASASTVESTLEALQAINDVTVTGSAGGPWTVTFGGAHAGLNVPQIQADGSTLVSGTVNRTISTTYDGDSRVTGVSDSDSTYGYTYDNIGRILTVSNSGTSGVPTVVFTSTWNANSDRTRLTATIASTADFQNDYTYDNLRRLTQIEQVGQGGGNTVAEKQVQFAYNAGSLIETITRKYKSGGSWTEAATTAFSYDTLNRLDEIDHKRSGTSLFTPYTYTYDRDDRITQAASQDGTSDYTYDAASQLTATDHSFQTDETYSWDNNGNRNSAGYTVGTNNRISTDGTYNYTYDDEGNVTRRTKISDSSVRDYAWDYRNRLTSVVDRVSAGGTITMQADYTYDVFDRRIKKVVDADGAGGGAAVTSRYVFEGERPNVTLQFDGSNNLTHRYLWGEALDQLLADENSSNAITWSLADHLGTTRDVVNNSGAVQNHLKWDSFGAVTSESASAVDFLMGFAGTIRDEETGHNYAWHRYLQSGRWLSEDPEGFNAGDVNLRRYVSNNPIGLNDPTGLDAESITLINWTLPDGTVVPAYYSEEWALAQGHPNWCMPVIVSVAEEDNPYDYSDVGKYTKPKTTPGPKGGRFYDGWADGEKGMPPAARTDPKAARRWARQRGNEKFWWVAKEIGLIFVIPTYQGQKHGKWLGEWWKGKTISW